MTQHQRARYRVARYVIVNNITTATLESKTKNAWKRRWQKRNGNSLNSLYLGVSDSFKDGSSKLNNHSAMAVGKFILALSVQFEFCFILCCFPLDFVWKWYEIELKELTVYFFFVSLMYEWKKPTCTFSYAGYACHTMCMSVFSFTPQGNKKKSTINS